MFLADEEDWVRMADLDGRRGRRRRYQVAISIARASCPPDAVAVDGVLTRTRLWLMEDLCSEGLRDVCCCACRLVKFLMWLMYGKRPLAQLMSK